LKIIKFKGDNMKAFLTIITTLLIGFGLGLITYKYLDEKQVPIQNLPKVIVGVCEYEGKTYEENESFPSSDGCNNCGCNNGEVVCTTMACE
jgi:hypothetical protein